MLSTKQAKDSTTITLNKADLTNKKHGNESLTSKRSILCIPGLQWWIRWYPAGETKTEDGYVSVFLCVNKPVKAKFTFAIENSSISETGSFDFTTPPFDWGWYDFASHEELRPLFRKRKLTITCSAEFEVLPPDTSVPRVFQLFEHVPTDVEFVMGSERVPAHKNFLVMISPVFQAMFAHNTAESKSGRIKITEFDISTVNSAIGFCYGRELENTSAETVVNILRFCDKYFITAVVCKLKKLPLLNLTTDSYCLVVRYAYDCNKDALLTACYTFFKENHDKIKTLKDFTALPMALVVDILKSAFDLKTDFDVLRHAHKNAMDFVMNSLEQPLLESMTIDNFCSIARYAWKCSREALKHACVKYLNDHRDEVLDYEPFHSLPSDVIAKILKASFLLKFALNQ